MTKRILVAADVHTHPVRGGNQQCIMQYVDVLRKLGCEVFFLYIDLYEGYLLQDDTQRYWGNHLFYYRTPSWQIICQKIRRRIEHCYYFQHLDVYYPHGLTQFVNKLHAKYHFDGLIVNYIWNSRLAECKIPIKAIYTHDVFTNRNEKLGKKDVWYSFPKDEETKGISRFANVLSIQDEESGWYREIAPHSNVRTVYSSFDFVEQSITANKNILFFSGGSQLNQEGIKRFVRDVWPLLKKRDSEIKLLLGGAICGEFRQEQLPQDIILMGRYDNPDDFYALGDICINPVYNGSGLKIKTFEAIAHGKVTIVHPHSALGVYHPDNIPLYRATEPQEYINAIFEYIGDKSKLVRRQMECKEYIAELNDYILLQYKEVFAI